LPRIGMWTAPENPNPDKIFDEAISDTKAGRYKDSLAKHVWFHENALKIEPAFYGVRLSFALTDWVELGKAYPPALAKPKTSRDQAPDRIRKAVGNHSTAPMDSEDLRDAFHDVVSINEHLKESDKTKELFLWLDSHKPRLANYLFELAEPALVEAKEYR